MRIPKMRAAPALALIAIAGLGGTAFSQTTGTSGQVSGENVSAGTYGSGDASGAGVGIAGGGDATANGGTASTHSSARLNERQAMQRSVAKAASGDERARSRTQTHVLPNDKVKSRTMSIYHQRGEKPVIERSTSSTPK